MCCIILPQAVSMHPSHFCRWLCCKTLRIRPSFVTSEFGGCASFVTMTVLSTFTRKPASLPTAFTRLSKICATSGPKVDINFDHVGTMHAPGVHLQNKHGNVCRQSCVEKQICGQHLVLQTLFSTETCFSSGWQLSRHGYILCNIM